MKLSTYHILKNAVPNNQIEVTGELLKSLKKELLGILIDFSNVCERYQYYYSLCGGTALGAVRHKGFIPWDDDIDVFMLRSDYEKFLKIFHTELGECYYLQSMETTPEIGMPITKLMKKGTVYKTYITPKDVDSGIHIDIFILENTPDHYLLRMVHGTISTGLGLCLSCARTYYTRERLREVFAGSDGEVIKAINQKIMIGSFLRFLPLAKWTKLYADWNKICKNDQSKYVVCAMGVKHYFGEIFLRQDYCLTKSIQFEQHSFKVIKNVEKALEQLYGDYMTIPPENKRERHFVLEIKLEDK